MLAREFASKRQYGSDPHRISLQRNALELNFLGISLYRQQDTT
jgi:hypothetical protein